MAETLQNYNTPTLPQLDGGSQVFWRNELQKISKSINLLVSQTTPLISANGAWTAWTPTLSAQSGTLTSATVAQARYVKLGKTVHYAVQINITTNGTAAGYLAFTLPVTQANANAMGQGREQAVSGKMVVVGMFSGDPHGYILTYDNLYPGANGAQIIVSGTYESQ